MAHELFNEEVERRNRKLGRDSSAVSLLFVPYLKASDELTKVADVDLVHFTPRK